VDVAGGAAVTERRVYALDLVDDAPLIAAYEARHATGAVWPQVLEGIRRQGCLSMEIWRVDTRLVMIAEVEADFPRPLQPSLREAAEAWEAEMDIYQRPLQRDGPKWTPMTRIFALEGDQAPT
jgi:L-rhamnose mutarotase